MQQGHALSPPHLCHRSPSPEDDPLLALLQALTEEYSPDVPALQRTESDESVEISVSHNPRHCSHSTL